MKALLAFCALLAVSSPLGAQSIIRMVGTPSWKITPPVCRFKVDGPIQNLSPAGTVSGTLKLSLFMSEREYPAPGTVVSEHTLGQLGGQFQIDRVKAKEPASIPNLTGTFHFTVVVSEYTTAGWRARAFSDTGTRKVKNGVFVTGTKWRIPKDPVLPPPTKLPNGTFFKFKLNATEQLDKIAGSSQTRTRVIIRKGKNARYQGPATKTKAEYSYKTGRKRVNGKRADIGKLVIDFRKAAGTESQTESQFELYFTSGATGYYKRTDLAGTGRRVTWGKFQMNGGVDTGILRIGVLKAGKPKITFPAAPAVSYEIIPLDTSSLIYDPETMMEIAEPDSEIRESTGSLTTTGSLGGTVSFTGAWDIVVFPLAPGSGTNQLVSLDPELSVEWLDSLNLGLTDPQERLDWELWNESFPTFSDPNIFDIIPSEDEATE